MALTINFDEVRVPISLYQRIKCFSLETYLRVKHQGMSRSNFDFRQRGYPLFATSVIRRAWMFDPNFTFPNLTTHSCLNNINIKIAASPCHKSPSKSFAVCRTRISGHYFKPNFLQ